MKETTPAVIAVLIVGLGYVMAALVLGGWITAGDIHIGWTAFSENQGQLAVGFVFAGVVIGGLVGALAYVLQRFRSQDRG